MEVKATDDGVVRIGSRVRLHMRERDEDGEVEFALVPDHDADATARRVSTDSPIGRALLGRHVGDRVKVRAPGGTVSVTVMSISQ